MKDATDLRARVRLNPMTSTETEVVWEEGQSLSEIFDNVCVENNIADEVREFFTIFLDGYEIESKLWAMAKPRKDSYILVAIRPAGGSNRGLFKQLAILAVTVTAMVLTQGMLNWQIAAIVGTTSIGATLALHSLMPDVLPQADSIGGYPTPEESSQMYTIQGQANKVKRYGPTPKVYGTHRVFPTVAANPYTEIGIDRSTGELSQFYYAIYDFGHGPVTVTDIKIGDTLIDEFSDVEWHWVDPNKPTYAEGEEPEWDKHLFTEFTMYKGDGDTASVSTAINANEDDTGAVPEDYQVSRSVPGLSDGCDQEIHVTLLAPRGLNSIATDGTHFDRNIELEVEFAEDGVPLGTETWIPFSDTSKVSYAEVIGSQSVDRGGEKEMFPPNMIPIGENTAIYIHLMTDSRDLTHSARLEHAHAGVGGSINGYNLYQTWMRNIVGFLGKGADSFVAQEGMGTHSKLVIRGIDVGRATSEVSLGYGYSRYILETPLTHRIDVYSRYYRRDTINHHRDNPPSGQPSDWTTDSGWYFTDVAIPKVSYFAGSSVIITNSSSKPVYSMIKFSPIKAADYKVRVTRKRSYGAAAYQVIDDLTWSTLGVRYDRAPVTPTLRHQFLELKIRATNQLSGSIQNLSGVASTLVDVYDPSTEVWTKQYSNNPAWVFCDLLTSPVNKRAIDKSRLDMNSIVEWADYCDEVPDTSPAYIDMFGVTFTDPRYTSNFVLDFDITLQQILSKVSQACAASLNLVDGKYGVLIDKAKTIPVQMFTNRNSWDFVSTRQYNDGFQAIKVKYIDGETWDLREVIVYANDYDATTATEFEEVTTFGCTNQNQAWRYGRFILAQAILRQETISITVDFEHLVCTRGDYVQIAQDVMKVGGTPARVIKVVGTEITIDTPFSPETGVDYGYTYRPHDGDITTSTMTITDPTTATVDGAVPNEGDLILWGEVGHITFDCLVKSITPSDDLHATLTLIEKADEIYEAESSGALPIYNAHLNIVADTTDSAPTRVEDLEVIENTYTCTGYRYLYYIDLNWLIPQGSVYEGFEIYVDNGTGYSLVESTSNIGYRYEVNSEKLEQEHNFKVIAVSANGNKLPLGEVDTVSAIPLPKTTPPSDVESLFLNVTGETIQLDWPALTDCDILEYLIRYSPSLTGTWEESVPLQKVDRRTTMVTSQARTGTYLIKAIDFNTNESDTAAMAITSIPELTNLNVIEATSDFPTLSGTMEQAEADDGVITIREKTSGGVGTGEYYSEGTYYFENFLDLGDIYTVRLQSQIRAEGFTPGDIMANWATLSDVAALANSQFSEWDVETYYRATEVFNTMSDWGTMDAVGSMSGGADENWTPWRKFTIGDFSGRVFAFKLRLVSYKAAVTPRVFDAVIKADMPDRREIMDNVISSAGATTLTYSTPFKGPGTSPNIQITQDNAQFGDYYKLTNRTLSGFTITFYDKDDNLVARQFDVSAEGYGRKTDTVL